MADALSMAADIIKEFEGFSATPYQCPAKVWTIGYGSTRDLDGNAVSAKTPPVTRTQATSLLMRDISGAMRDVERRVQVYITAPQKAALISFVYNLGSGAFGGSTLLRKLNASDYKGAADEFPKWVYSAGKLLNGLVRRRNMERDIFLKDTLHKDVKLT